MTAWVLTVAGLAAVVGAFAGIALRRVIAGVPGAHPPRRPALEATTALAFGLVAGSVAHLSESGSGPAWSRMPIPAVLVAVAFLWLAAASMALAVIDVETRRLPDALVLPGYLSGGALLGTAALLSGDGAAALRAGVGLVAVGGFYLVLRLIRPEGMGGGDVKLAGVLGMHLGWAGWVPLVIGAVSAFLLGGIVSIVVLASRRGGRRATIAFGPWMIAGAWIGLAWGGALVRAYTGSLLPA